MKYFNGNHNMLDVICYYICYYLNATYYIEKCSQKKNHDFINNIEKNLREQYEVLQIRTIYRNGMKCREYATPVTYSRHFIPFR